MRFPFPAARAGAPRARLATLALAATMLAAPGAHALTLYDNFSAASLSPFRWNGSETTESDAVIVDSRRVLEAGHLRLEAKSYGSTVSNNGNGVARFGMRLARSIDVTAIQATFTLRTALTTACAGNTGNASQIDLRVGGGFFNADRRSLPGDSLLNDVQAWIALSSNVTDPTITVKANVVQCLNDSCTATTSLGTATLGSTSLNIPVAISVTWDKAGHQFAFASGLSAGIAYVPYTVTDVQPAHDLSKHVEVLGQPAHCTASRAWVYGGAEVDDVYTNTLP